MHPSTRQLNDYADGDLTGADESAVRAHVEGCPACRAVVDEFRTLQQVARTLDPVDPPERAWTKIKSGLLVSRQSTVVGRQSTVSRQSTVWWLAAAAVVVLAVGGGLLFRNYLPSRNQVASSGQPELGPDAQSVEAELAAAERHYQNAITALEKIANAEQGTFDPKTAAALQKNLAVVDQAISESRAALRAQPTSEPAQQSLLDSFKAKVSLLQYTVALINEMRKGDEAGAARVASGIKRGS
jgi:anti-sigma factor ChrR (cupin superfamily)